MPERDILVAANEVYADDFSKGAPADAARPAAGDRDVHGRAPRPGEVPRAGGGRRARDPQCRRARDRGRPALARHLALAPRDPGGRRARPHRLRDAHLLQRRPARRSSSRRPARMPPDVDFRPFADLEECVRRSLADDPRVAATSRTTTRPPAGSTTAGAAGSRRSRWSPRRSSAGGLGETQSVPSGRAARPEDCVLGRARSLRLRTLPASLFRNDHRTPTASDVPPSPPYRRRACGWASK